MVHEVVRSRLRLPRPLRSPEHATQREPLEALGAAYALAIDPHGEAGAAMVPGPVGVPRDRHLSAAHEQPVGAEPPQLLGRKERLDDERRGRGTTGGLVFDADAHEA
eukprot:2995840-Prymnesium_polylepis.1